MSPALEISIDGACRGNPGPAGIGVVITQAGKEIRAISKPIGEATNNIAEYSALIYGLMEALTLKAERIIVHADSQLVCRQLGGIYQIKDPHLKFLYDQALLLFKNFKSVEIRHRRREENARADQLAGGAVKDTAKGRPHDRPEAYLFGEESPSSAG